MKKRLGEILLERGLINIDQLDAALVHQRQWGVRLGAALVAKGFIAEGALTQVLSESLAIPMVDLARVVVDERALQALPRRLCETYDVFPIALKEGTGRRVLLLAMADPLNATAIDEIGFTTATVVKPTIAQISSLRMAVRRYFYSEDVVIPPLSFERGSPAAPAPHGSSHAARDAGEDASLISTGAREVRVIGASGATTHIVHLTDEVTERAAVDELHRGHARHRVLVDTPQRGATASLPPEASARAEGAVSGSMAIHPSLLADGALSSVRTSLHPSLSGSSGFGSRAEPVQHPVAVGAKARRPQTVTDPYASSSLDFYMNQPSGSFALPMPSIEGMPIVQATEPLSLAGAEIDATEGLEKKFWAVMRVLARKGLVTKDELLAELQWDDESY